MTATVGVTAASDFATVLKRLRRACGLSQEALAERANISTQAVSSLECGLRKSPYPRTIALLADALGVDESGRNQLEAAAAAHRAARATDETPGMGVSQLPAALTAIVGRDRDVVEIGALLRSGRFVTISGSGGIGKTTLALEAARNIQQHYANGAIFCDLSALRDPVLVASAIASAAGVLLRDGCEPAAALATALRGSTLLLVLDNCEQFVSDVARVATQVLGTCPNVTILATSRRRIGGPSEVVYRVPPLADAPAVALFAQRASAVNPGFALTDETELVVVRICRRLDGIALAIELAAAQTRVMSVTDLERRLERRFRLLQDSGAPNARRRTLLAAFEWSYELLSARERRFFRALGVFTGTFPLEAALEICCDAGADELDALELLAALVDASLVVADARGPATRYRLLETTRAYATELLVGEDEWPGLSARHLAYYAANAKDLNLALDVEDVRGALRFALDSGAAATGAQLLAVLGARWSRVGMAAEGVEHLETFIPAIREEDAITAARAWIALAFLRGAALRNAAAFDAAQIAVTFARRTDDDVILFNALRALATVATLQSDFALAAASIAELEEVIKRCPSPVRTLLLLDTQGIFYHKHGESERAVEVCRSALRAARQSGDAFLEVSAVCNLAEIEHECGRTREARALVDEMRGKPALGGISSGPLLANLAGYAIALNDAAAALVATRDLVAQRATLPASQTYITTALEHAALAHALLGDTTRAARIAGYCERWYRDAGYERQYTEQQTHERLVRLLDERLDPQERVALSAAGALLTEDRAVREALGDQPTTGAAALAPSSP